ncbi:autophagy protein, putative [Perkinsus marinus ATCC 50983]|uniref:Autophagy protein, putative n=1 Tax=Perkinsus marinus (strain ATCC 50983 / TXsc) TaxID=423536 RepID=C5KD35_PERM5|nr:autophagy protein, putative [Perkinsus marinus ATCC 50983]EER17784.1 autophagy protein, putative [Perkinsus marinus ATCC 50983]|eukprot:XP_002785988.1 autophagy protein, putative [Perkinsus marinus ATCC 50983]
MSIIVEFTLPVLQLDTEFWQTLADYKLNVQRLGTSAIETVGEMPPHDPSRILCSTVKEVSEPLPSRGCCLGRVYNHNTIQDFAKADRQAIVGSSLDQILSTALSPSSSPGPVGPQGSPARLLITPQLLYFIVICYADLKNFKFTYNCAVPRLAFKTPLIVTSAAPMIAEAIDDDALLARLTAEMVLLRYEDNTLSNLRDMPAGRLLEVLVLVANLPEPNAATVVLPWYMSTLLVAIMTRFKSTVDDSITLRLVHQRGSSVRITVVVPGDLNACVERVPGWIAFPGPQGKPTVTTTWAHPLPSALDLRRVMDPAALAVSATDLNVRLMQWRVLPTLDPDRIMNLRCLLIGAGTLGCAVSRTLLAWGVKNITFVDSGHVSFSNPARQNLFTYEDAVGKRPKAEAAAARLGEIVPGLNVSGVQLEVPMPGKSTTGGIDDISRAVEKLDSLIAGHDVVFLLTDSRESRWLPTVMVASAGAKTKGGPMGVSVALGFDSYLVKVQSYGGGYVSLENMIMSFW